MGPQYWGLFYLRTKMAQNLQLLKRRIKTAQNISQIAKAMEMIAASKIKRAQTAVENNKPYSDRISKLTKKLIQTIESEQDKKKFSHPYINNHSDSKRNLLIAFSPDKGLCGSLNTNLYKKILEVNSKETDLITIGNKIGRFASKLDFNLIASFPMGTSLPPYSRVIDIIGFISEYYNTGKVATVEVLFPEFRSFFSQVPIIQTLLPINHASEHEDKQESYEENLPYIFEPSVEAILQELLPYYIEVKIYSALIESYTSQQAAQMMAMQNAKNNARDLAEAFTLAYNKSRQERITTEILDITNTAV